MSATRVHETAIINCPTWKVWKLIRPLDFVYMPTVATVRMDDANANIDSVGTTRTVIYVDGTKQTIRLLELSDSRTTITWELLTSEPEHKAMSVVHTVRLRRVTADQSTFIEWKTDFSKDATNEVIEDARHKQRENFAALRKEAVKKFNFHSVAEDVVKGWEGKGTVVLITGANSGIGLECVRVFLQSGSHVIGGVRNPKESKTIFDPFLKTAPTHAKLDLLPLDLNSLKSVRTFASSFKDMKIPLHILILNAGIMAVPQRTLTEEKLESQFGVNHVAHHLLATLLIDVVKKSAPSRVVVLSSAAHRFGSIMWDDYNWEKSYDRWKAYGQSKTANILFVKQLQATLNKESQDSKDSKESKSGSKVDVFAVHPGGIKTGLGRSLLPEDVKMMESRPFRWKTIPQGAATTMVAAVSPDLTGKGGIYLADCNEVAPLAYATDMAQAARLWELTEKIISERSK